MKLLQPLKQVTQLPDDCAGVDAAAERIFEILDEPTETDHRPRNADATRAISTPSASTTCRFAYAAGQRAGAVGRVLRRRGGARCVALVGAERRWEEHPGRSHSALRRADRRAGSSSTASTRANIALPALRALTGIVSQDTVLFNDTVRRNIAYGGEGRYTDAQIEAAARAANAHDFIRSCPQGYDTVLGERGTRLSGRPAAAARHRARAAHRPADPHSRRGDVVARHRERAAGAGGDRPPARRSDGVRDRAPAVDDDRRRPDPGARSRTHRRARHARRAAGAARRLSSPVHAAIPRSRRGGRRPGGRGCRRDGAAEPGPG